MKITTIGVDLAKEVFQIHDCPFLELGRVFLLRDLLHLLPPKCNGNCTSPLEDYLSGESHIVIYFFKKLVEISLNLAFKKGVTNKIIKVRSIQTHSLRGSKLLEEFI